MFKRLLIAITVFALTACGKKGALVYPDMLVPAAPTGTSVSQFGSSVKLQFVLPENDRTGRKLPDLAGAKINKREGDSNQEQTCGSCMTDYSLFRKMYLDLLPDGTQRYGNRILVLDGDVSAGKSYSYSVVPFTKDGLDGLASPQVSVVIVQPALPPILSAESFPTEIRISLVSLPPVAGHFAGYNIYRTSQQAQAQYLPVNSEPLMSNEYLDSGLERNVTYSYSARVLVKLESGHIIESLISNVAEGMLKNDE